VRYNPLHDAGSVRSATASVLANWSVNFFFVISGFIITKLALKERSETDRFSAARFYIRRWFRIVPALAVYLSAIILWNKYSLIDQPYSGIIKAATFTCNLTQCGSFTMHTWSLAYEEQFYLAFPLLFLLARRHSAIVFLCVFAAIVSAPFLFTRLHLGEGWHISARFALSFSFICGGALAAFYEPQITKLAEQRCSVYISLGAAVVLCFLFWLNTHSFQLASALSRMQAWLTIPLLPICIAWTIARSTSRTTMLTTILTVRPLVFFGTISYSLYVWHQAFAAPASLYTASSPLLFSPLMIGAAVLSYYAIERPCIQIGKRLIRSFSDIPVIERLPNIPAAGIGVAAE
jgi:peptidoglycan/LPS O-acetylase OafA/YrhL